MSSFIGAPSLLINRRRDVLVLVMTARSDVGFQAPEPPAARCSKTPREQVSTEVVKRLETKREVVRMTQKWRAENVTKRREKGARATHTLSSRSLSDQS